MMIGIFYPTLVFPYNNIWLTMLSLSIVTHIYIYIILWWLIYSSIYLNPYSRIPKMQYPLQKYNNHTIIVPVRLLSCDASKTYEMTILMIYSVGTNT